MRFRAILVLVLYLLATLGIVAVLLRMFVPDVFGGMFVGGMMASAPKTGGIISLVDWVIMSIWLLWPVWYVIWLPIAQALTMPLLVRSTDVAPLGRRVLIAPSLASGLMGGWLVVGAIWTATLVLITNEAVETKLLSDYETTIMCGILATGIIVWIGWTFYWLRKGRGTPPIHAYAKQCRCLIIAGLVCLLIGGLVFILSWKVDTGMTAFLAMMGAVCTLSFAFQPVAFLFLMRHWEGHGAGRDQNACGPTSDTATSSQQPVTGWKSETQTNSKT